MRSVLLLILVAAFPVVAEEAKDEKVKKALKELEGTWTGESAVDSKEGVGNEIGWEWIFAGDKVTKQNPGDGARKNSTARSIPPFRRRSST